MDAEDSEQQQACVVCRQHHDQMLMLSCIHDPCINCAAKHYVETEPEDSNVYTCSSCGQETELDASSIFELRKIYNHNKRKRKMEAARNNASFGQQPRGSPLAEVKNQRNHKEVQEVKRVTRVVEQPELKKSTHAPTQPYPSAKTTTSHGLQYPCHDHPEEELTYFCFSCSRPICPECAIHGLHKDHKMETTRKAIKQIRALLLQDKQKLDGEAKGLLESREKGKRLAKALLEQSRNDQEYIKKKMTHLKNVLSEKEKELVKAAENNLDKNMERVRHEEALAERTLSEIMGIHRSIDATLKKEDLVILQEYSSRDEEVTQMLAKADANKDTVLDFQEKNSLRSVNLSLVDQETDRLSSEIYSLKLATVLSKEAHA